MPWWARVDMVASAVDSWPPPRVPVEMKRPAFLPQKPPEAQILPVLSQKACKGASISAMPVPSMAGEYVERFAYLPLSREVTISGRDTQQETIVLL